MATLGLSAGSAYLKVLPNFSAFAPALKKGATTALGRVSAGLSRTEAFSPSCSRFRCSGSASSRFVRTRRISARAGRGMAATLSRNRRSISGRSIGPKD
jgi:hypothetical protein